MTHSGDGGPPAAGSSHRVITKIACGLRHSLIATAHGCVMTSGAGKKGQLGCDLSSASPELHVSHKKHSSFKKSSSSSTSRFRFHCIWNHGQTEVGSSHPRVKTAFAGSFHSGVLVELESSNPGTASTTATSITTSATISTTTTSLFLWGCNKYGQLGRDPRVSAGSCVPICLSDAEIFGGEEHPVDSGHPDHPWIEDIASGWTHLLLRTNQGSVYRSGSTLEFIT